MGIFNGKKAKNEANKNESLLVTKESLCSTCALFSLLAFLILCTRSFIFGDLGLAIHSFLIGAFGYLAYPLALGVLYLSIMGLIGKRLVKNRRFVACLVIACVFVALIVHTAVDFNRVKEGGYVGYCFLAGTSFPASTVAGVIGGLIVYGVVAVMSNIGAIVLFSLFTAFFVYLCVLALKNPPKAKEVRVKEEKVTYAEQPVKQPVQQPTQQGARVAQNPYAGIRPEVTQKPGVSLRERENPSAPVDDSYSPFGKPEMLQDRPYSQPKTQDSREILFGGDPAENFRRNLLFNPNSSANTRPCADPAETGYVPSYTEAYQNDVNNEETRPPMTVVGGNSYSQPEEKTYEEAFEEEEPIIEPMPYVEEEKPVRQEPVSYPIFDEPTVEEPKDDPYTLNEEPKQEEKPQTDYRRHDYMNLFSPENPRLFGEKESPRTRDSYFDETPAQEESTEIDRGFGARGRGEEELPRDSSRSAGGLHIFDEEEKSDPYTLESEDSGRRGNFDIESTSRGVVEEPTSRRGVEEPTMGFGSRDLGRGAEPPKAEPVKAPEPKQPEPPKPRIIRPYKRVPLDDFDCRDVEPAQNEEEVEQTKQDIIATLEDFKVMGATIASVTFGPTVTRYNVALPRNVAPRKVVALDQSIAISLHSSGVNIYPNYEDGVVSIEVPNKERQFVQLGCMLSGDTFVNAAKSSLMFAMGKDVANVKVYGDISKMIHMLVAGSSGSGKSVFLGSLIISMIYKYSPEELRLILIDPKKTEFVLYNNLPHLMINEIITDVNKAVQSLNWAIGEMNRRYGLFEQMSRSGKYVVNLDQYNEQLEKNERLPKIVIIIDELADLMLAAKKDIEDKIQNLTQKARAAGIHLIVATQRPSADVITGVIKSNLSTRIAFGVASDVDSRVILDQSGAQNLLGKGDFLYSMPGTRIPIRVQSAFISPSDSQKVVNFIKANNEAYYDEEATAYINNTRMTTDDPASGDKGEIDPMYIEALRHVIISGSASISMIQRKCSAGYNRAGKIIEWMEDMGYISAFDGAKARKVLISKEDFESKYGPL